MMRKSIVLITMIALTFSSLNACKNKEEAVSDPSINVEEPMDDSPVNDKETVSEASLDVEIEVPDSPADEEIEEQDINYLSCYAPVLTRIHYAMTYPRDDFQYRDGEDWLYEISHYANGTTNLGNYGYCLIDVSGDQIPELILTDKAGETVYNLYTLIDSKPYLICSGYNKSIYSYLGDGLLS